jgi:hypothetical protein
MDKAERIAEEILTNETIMEAIGNYGEWNHIELKKIIKPIIVEIIDKHYEQQ